MTKLRTVRNAGADRLAAERVLGLAATGLQALAASLDSRFDRALDLLAAVEGRVVVTGMGKSGHIARKIAATLASTGTPALFVHPAEASHGDLGMIAERDGVIALSNSGSTAEMGHIVAHAKRFRLPLIAITSRGESAFAEAADAALILPKVQEACPVGMAPTTSTTMMLALGDALAVALMERRGFTATDFHALHPGGQLGQQLRRVTELMHTGPGMPLIALGQPMNEAIIEMTGKSLGCVGVVDGAGLLVGIVDAAGLLVGIITDGDLRRHMATPDILHQPVEQVMTRGPRTVRPQATIAEALGLMAAKDRRPITSLFVVEEGKPVGLLHMHDCLRAGAL